MLKLLFKRGCCLLFQLSKNLIRFKEVYITGIVLLETFATIYLGNKTLNYFSIRFARKSSNLNRGLTSLKTTIYDRLVTFTPSIIIQFLSISLFL